jgi:uncharacterized protein YxjI
MKLLLRQKIFSWLDSYDIYDSTGQVYFTVKSQFDFRHHFEVYHNNQYVGSLREEIFRFLPHFELYHGNQMVGEIVKQFSLILPRFSLNYQGWNVEGDWMGWNYEILDSMGQRIAGISKELFHFTDVYCMEIDEEKNAVDVVMIVLAIDAVKCDQNRNR